VGADDAADDDAAARTAVLDFLDMETNVAVVDQNVVAGAEHLADDHGSDRQLPVRRVIRVDDRYLAAGGDGDRRVEVPHADLRSLEVADQRQRPADCVLDLTHETGPCGMLLVRSV
jgi:hypothetical protein